jgi:molecular chaperone DnaJ
MDYKNYYDILGVSKNAAAKDIKSAYRKLARKYHPDVNPGDKASETRFKEINEAYEVLGDPEKRKKYDEFGSDFKRYQETGQQPGQQSYGFDFDQWVRSQQGGGQQGPYDFETGGPGGGGFSDFFELLFGGGAAGRRRTTAPGRRTRAMRGEDVEYPVDVTLEEAYSGTQRLLQMQINEPCPKCGGTGLVQGNICPTCSGAGTVPRLKRIETKIPAGVQAGSRVRISGQGAPGLAGGPPGDLYLKVNVLPNETFELQGKDIYVDVPVDLYTALLGGEVEVPTLKGKVALTIPPETQNGKVFRLRGQGMPDLRNPEQKGDLYARVKVVLPTRLTDREKSVFAELQGARGSSRSR